MSAIFQANGDPPTFPPYIQNFHHDLMTGDRPGAEYPYNVKAYLGAALAAGSPYANATTYDPNEALDLSLARVEAFEAEVGASDVSMYETYLTEAAGYVPTVLDSQAQVDAMVDAYDRKQRDKLRVNVNSFCGAMFDVRATQNSQFQMALAMMYRDHNREVGEYRANLEMQERKTQSLLISQAASEMTRLHFSKLDYSKIAAQLVSDLHLKRIVANKELYAEELALAEADATYELELFRYGENMLHALSGVATVPPKLPRAASALASMAGGAGMAVQVATAVGGAAGPQAGIAAGLLSLLLLGGSGWGQGF